MSSSWYRDSYEAVKRVYGDDADMFCALLALTSANCAISANSTLAKKAYNQIKLSGTVKRESFCRTHYVGIVRYLSDGEIHGRKCGSFYECMTNEDSEHIPVDMWMMRLYHMGHDVPSAKEYDAIEADVVKRARELGIQPRDYQARLWEEIRGNGGSYAVHFAQWRLL